MTSHVEALVVTAGATEIAVAGKAMLTAPAVEVGTDATGDGAIPGSDLVSASITRPSPNQLRFDLKVDDLPPVLGGTPEVLNYVWPLEVARNNQFSSVELQAWRTSTGADALCGVIFACPGQPIEGNPRFTVNTCAPDPNTGQNTCSSEGVQGEFTEDGLAWIVPTGLINASGGATLQAGSSIAASVGATGLYWYNNGNGGDTMFWDGLEVPGPTVELGIASADTAEEDVPLTAAASVTSAGNFSGSLPLPPEPGSYRVTAKACLGPDSCGTASSLVTVE